MIKVTKDKNIITVTGHAGSNEYGRDIVCASVSSIIYTTINAIAKIGKGFIKVTDNDSMIIKILTDDEIVKTLIDNMMELLKSLNEDYPKNIIVKEN